MNMNRVSHLTIGTATVLAVAIGCYAAILDGTHGTVKVTPNTATADKGEKEFQDTLSFADGKFSSAFFGAKGFKSAVYRGEKEANEAEFEAEQTNDTGGVLNWQGEIRGARIAGRLMWMKKDSPAFTYTFQGTTE